MHFSSFSINSWLNSRSCRDVCLEFNAKIMKNSSGMHGTLLLKASKEIKCWGDVKSWIGPYILMSQFLFFWALFNYIQQQNISCFFDAYLNVSGKYRKVARSNTSRLEAQAGFFRLLMKGIFDPYVLWPFDKKLIFWLVILVRTRD